MGSGAEVDIVRLLRQAPYPLSRLAIHPTSLFLSQGFAAQSRMVLTLLAGLVQVGFSYVTPSILRPFPSIAPGSGDFYLDGVCQAGFSRSLEHSRGLLMWVTTVSDFRTLRFSHDPTLAYSNPPPPYALLGSVCGISLKIFGSLPPPLG